MDRRWSGSFFSLIRRPHQPRRIRLVRSDGDLSESPKASEITPERLYPRARKVSPSRTGTKGSRSHDAIPGRLWTAYTRTPAAQGAPDSKHQDLATFLIVDVIDVIAALREQDSPYTGYLAHSISPPDVRSLRKECERAVELGVEEIWRRRSVRHPPSRGVKDLPICLGRSPDFRLQLRVLRTRKISSLGFVSPAAALRQDRPSASWSAARSSSSRSSSSLAIVNSTTAPSGSSVGSSRTKRPFRTCAFRVPIDP